jgi:O-antigen/teichoic acid export membrane protein
VNATVHAQEEPVERRRSEALLINLFGLADQALISATSFVTLLVLARALSASAFGAFALAYMVLLFVNSVQSALVTQPHNVIGATRQGLGYQRFTGATAVGGLLFMLTVVLVLAVVEISVLGSGAASASIVLAMIPATVAWQLQEVTRRIMYTEGRLGAALANDCVAYGGQAVGIVLLWQIGHIDGPNALYVLGATSLAGALVGYAQTRRSFGRPVDRGDLLAHWHFGKWLAAAAVGFGVSAYVYFYVAALLLGTAASGELKAAQLALGPLNVMLIFLATVLPIRLSRTLAFVGEVAFAAYLRRAFVVTAPIVAFYCLLATLLANGLLALLYGDRYTGAADLVALFAAYYFLSYLGQMAASTLNARRNTRPIFLANVVGAVSTLLLGWVFISAAGINGAVLGMIASAVLVDLTLARYASKDLRRAAISSAT